MSTPPFLDHLIFFLPCDPKTSTPLIFPSLAKAFTTVPGGTHADGLTANTLIPLADGSYIELICFLPSAPADAVADHWWGPDRERKGWVDWCLTTEGSAGGNCEKVNGSGNEKVYAKPIRGGRKRVDGVQVEWEVTFPLVTENMVSSAAGNEDADAKKREEDEVNLRNGQSLRGLLPFFCHDITPRDVRVPAYSPSKPHPCGALGVQDIDILVRDKVTLDRITPIYERVLGPQEILSEDLDGKAVKFHLGRVKEPGVESPLGKDVAVWLRVATSEPDIKCLSGREFCVRSVLVVGEGKATVIGGNGEEEDLYCMEVVRARMTERTMGV